MPTALARGLRARLDPSTIADRRHGLQPQERFRRTHADKWLFDVFQVKAGYLLAARAEDGLPLPSGQEDPLIAELTETISADLRRAGLAER
jgi:hypothetical protein